MKSRVFPILVGGFAVLLTVVLVGSAPGAGVSIPNGSIGLNKLTPKVRKLVTAHRRQGPQGTAGLNGEPGAAGSTGATGPEGKAAQGSLLTYSFRGSEGPLVLTRGDGSVQESVGPLTFAASCEPEGEDTIRGKLEVTSNENGVFVNGKALNAGVTKTLQELSISGGGSEESFPTVLRMTNEAGTFAVQGVSSLLVGLPGGCHFFGTLIEDS